MLTALAVILAVFGTFLVTCYLITRPFIALCEGQFVTLIEEPEESPISQADYDALQDSFIASGVTITKLNSRVKELKERRDYWLSMATDLGQRNRQLVELAASKGVRLC